MWLLDARKGDVNYRVKVNGIRMDVIAARPDAVLVYSRDPATGKAMVCRDSPCTCDGEPQPGTWPRHYKKVVVKGDVTVERTGALPFKFGNEAGEARAERQRRFDVSVPPTQTTFDRIEVKPSSADDWKDIAVL